MIIRVGTPLPVQLISVLDAPLLKILDFVNIDALIGTDATCFIQSSAARFLLDDIVWTVWL